MLNKILTGVIIIAVVLLVFLAYFGGRWQNKDKIHQAELEMEILRSTKDSLETVVAYRDSLEKIIGERITEHKDVANDLRKEVFRLEEARKEDQIKVRLLDNRYDLEEKFIKTFPEYAAVMRITEFRNEEEDIGLEYLSLPLYVGEDFILYYQNSNSFELQRNKLHSVDSLNQMVINLQDSIIVLEKQNRMAYQDGFNSSVKLHESLSQKYIDELSKGKLGWGWSVAGILGAGAAGVLIGSTTK